MLELGADLSGHSYGAECVQCPGRDGLPAKCDHAVYFRKRVAFVCQHTAEYVTALHSPTTSSHVLRRLDREYATLPPRHDGRNRDRRACTCNPHHCLECGRLTDACERCRALPLRSRPRDCRDCQRLQQADMGVQIGRTSPVHPPTPHDVVLDILIAIDHGCRTYTEIARHLSTGGTTT